MWSDQFVGLDPVTGEEVLERLTHRLDAPPSVKELISSIKTVRNAEDSARIQARALAWEASATPDDPTTFAEWAKTQPEGRVRRLVQVLDGKSYVRAELEEVIAKGTEIFAAMSAAEPTVEERYTWSRHNPPCDLCRRPVENGPNSQARYDRDSDTWTNAHVVCPVSP